MNPIELAVIDEAIYDESFRALGEQAKVLDGLRTRAGTIVAVANVTTAFLAGLALLRASGAASPASEATLGFLEWAAIACFCATLGLGLIIVAPSRDWVFVHHPHALLRVYVDPGPQIALSQFRRAIAHHNGALYNANARRLRTLGGLFSAATVVLSAEVIVWIVVLAT